MKALKIFSKMSSDTKCLLFAIMPRLRDFHVDLLDVVFPGKVIVD